MGPSRYTKARLTHTSGPVFTFWVRSDFSPETFWTANTGGGGKIFLREPGLQSSYHLGRSQRAIPSRKGTRVHLSRAMGKDAWKRRQRLSYLLTGTLGPNSASRRTSFLEVTPVQNLLKARLEIFPWIPREFRRKYPRRPDIYSVGFPIASNAKNLRWLIGPSS